MTGLITPEVAAMTGHAVIYHAPEPLGAASIRYFALATGSDPDRWIDGAPPTLVCETNQLTGRAEPDDDGYLGHVWAIPFPVPMVMVRGGNDYRFHRRARPSDRITTTWTLVDIRERTGRDGVAMAIVIAEARYTGAEGDPIATNTETLIYRAAG